ncbi:calcium-activated chloride channel regulator 4A-like [Ptychodera flava]|uniref:calcium-activated chloride channel regulator 4A-like n=1 Tax=Ptychodera flava TaxID=63121 RepID=UPI003969CC26
MATSIVMLMICIAGIMPSSANRNLVRLTDNRYSTVLVAINENVVEDRRLLDYIKDIFSDASARLYEATNQRASFSDVTILIPKTWSRNITSERANTERYDIANVIVDEANPDYGDSPYTKQPYGCGQKAEYIHLTPRWITDREYAVKYWGDSGKVVVHEWGHLQWGLFDEYPIEEDEHFYLDTNGRVEPSRCSESITGVSYDIDRGRFCNLDPDSGVLPGPGCRFFPDGVNVGTGSYMYANYLDTVLNFCHDDPNGDSESRHSTMSLNKQNKQCAYRSAWDVMNSSADFYSVNAPQANMDTQPAFRVVQEAEFRSVLVLDLSNSMNSNSRVEKQRQAAASYISFTLPNNSWVGIVEFNNGANVIAPLTQLVDEQSRQDLTNMIPTTLAQKTCIGCGLLKGIEVLETSQFGDAAGGIIFLTTDGKETMAPRIGDVTDELVTKQVIVDTLAFSDAADPKLVQLSDDTGGQACWYSESDQSTAVHDCFTTSVTDRISSGQDALVQLTSTAENIEGSAAYINIAYIDSSIGRDTTFSFFWEFGKAAIVVSVTKPDGTIIDSSDSQYYSDIPGRSIIIKVDGIAEPGTWEYDIQNTDSARQAVQIYISSKAADSSASPIRLTSTPSINTISESPPKVLIYADLNQGYSPVLNAEVIATIERPSPHSNVELQLFDTGLGADVTKDDGVYSAYFIDFVDATCSTACRYNVKVTANVTDGRAESRFTGAGLGALPRNYSVIPEKKEGTPVGAFNRVASGGVIQVDDGVTYVDWSDPDDDPFPPSRISDLQVIATSVDNATVTLTWTATGDNYDIGTTSVSDLRYDTQFENMAYRFDNCSQLSNDNLTEGNLTDPLPSGQREIVTVRLPSSGVGVTYYFAIRAVDGVGNTGQPSFIAQTTIVYAAPDETTTEIPPSTQPRAVQSLAEEGNAMPELTTFP